MKNLLLLFGKLINRIFGYSMQDHRYFKSWEYIYRIGLLGMGRLTGNPIEKSGELDVIKKILASPGNEATIFDVGANKGQYSSHIMAEVKGQKKLQLHLFEPAISNVPMLKEQFNSSRYPDHFFIVNQFALSDTNSTGYLYTDEHGSDLGSLLNLKVPIRPFDDNKKETVETVKLDHYAEKNNIKIIDFLKIDVEGAEYKVLSGAMNLIDQKRIKNIQFEFGAGNITARIFFNDFWELLSSRYHFFQVLSGGLVPVTKYNTDMEIFKTTNYFLVLK